MLKFSFPDKEEAEALLNSQEPQEGHPVPTPLLAATGTHEAPIHVLEGLSAVTLSEAGHQLAIWIKVFNEHEKGLG